MSTEWNGGPYGSIRKAEVMRVRPATGQMDVVYHDSGIGGIPLPLPFLGGLAQGPSGFFSAPQISDFVGVIHEPHFAPIGAISSLRPHKTLPVHQPGESGVYHADGRVCCHLTNDGQTVLFTNKDGSVKITVDPTTKRVNITAPGGIFVNNQQVTIP